MRLMGRSGVMVIGHYPATGSNARQDKAQLWVGAAPGSGERIGLSRQAKQDKEVQSPRYQSLGFPCGWIGPGTRQNASIFTTTGRIWGSESVILAIFTNGKPIISGCDMGE